MIIFLIICRVAYNAVFRLAVFRAVLPGVVLRDRVAIVALHKAPERKRTQTQSVP